MTTEYVPAEPVVRLWTTWADYGATGEGRTLLARIGHAATTEEAIADFGAAFDPFFGGEAQPGVIENAVTRVLFSRAAMKRARELEGRATVILEGRLHINAS